LKIELKYYYLTIVLSSDTRKFIKLVKMTKRKQQFYRDTLNLFMREDCNYHWSRSYWYYATLPDKDSNNICTSGVARVGCVLEFFDCKEIVTWCADNFFQNRRTIPLHNGSHVSLAPSIFKKKLKLPELNLTYKEDKAITFLKRKNNGIELLQEYLQDPTEMPKIYP
jgi:hypothetical protein